MIKAIIPLLISSLFLSSNYAFADSKRLSTAIKIISTGEAMYVKIVSKAKTLSPVAAAKVKKTVDS